jgi:hypothetical protein
MFRTATANTTVALKSNLTVVIVTALCLGLALLYIQLSEVGPNVAHIQHLLQIVTPPSAREQHLLTLLRKEPPKELAKVLATAVRYAQQHP